MLDVRWRPRAHLDRESIALYLGFELGNPDAALAAIRRIDDALDRVRRFPDSGAHVRIEGLENSGYRRVLVDPYIVFYRFDDEVLTVCRILHQRQDIDARALVEFPRG